MTVIKPATVVRVSNVATHPDADRLDVLMLDALGVVSCVVVGQHYDEGQLGIYIPAGLWIPGWLAEDLWLVAKGSAWFHVEPRNIRGVMSDGLFAGEHWHTKPGADQQDWPLWKDRWRIGDDVSAYLGVIGRAP